MTEQIKNFAYTTLAEDLDNSETTITVTDGSVFPSSGNFRVVVDVEIMLCTARSSNDLTVTRGHESTSATTHSNGATIKHVITTGGLQQFTTEYSHGYEYDYVEDTDGWTTTATTEGTADTGLTANAVTYDGSTRICIEFFCMSAKPQNTANAQLTFVLYDGSSSIGQWGLSRNQVTGQNAYHEVLIRRFLTPSAASHTYSVRTFVSTGTGTILAGAGGSGNTMPAYLRQTKA